MMLHADSLPWGGDAHVTLSFAPDGSHIAGLNSTLFASLNAVAPQASWQDAILKAFQTWAVETNAAVGVVPDGGQDFGANGATRNDPRFGDVRIGAAPLAQGTLAIAIPADDILSGTWVGDVIFNSDAVFTSLSDVFAVALHEAGHVFGMEHSTDPLSPMHVHGITPVTSLTASDISNLQQLHGQPQPDLNELIQNNDSRQLATHLDVNRVGVLPEGTAPSVIYGKLSTPTDVDYLRIVSLGDYNGPLTFQLRTQGISLLSARLRILDADGNQLASTESTHIGGDVLTITLPSVSDDKRYYAVVDSTRSDAFSMGDYSLTAKFDGVNVVDQSLIDYAAGGALWSLPQDEIAKALGSSDGEVEFNDDSHTDDNAGSGTALTPSPGFAPDTRFEAIGSIADASDVDFYKVESPDTGGSVLTVRVHSLEAGGLTPAVSALDENGNPLPARVLVNGGGELVIQISNVAAGSEITLRVSAAESAGPFNRGNYQLTVGFGVDEVILQSAAQGTLTAAAPIADQSLYVALPQLFHFALNVDAETQATNAAVVARVYDAAGNVVFQVAARPGETRSAASVLLKPGTYRAEFAGIEQGGQLSDQVTYSLLARASSDPFVGDPDDPTFQPVFECPDMPGFYCYPGNFISPNPFLWDDFLNSLPPPPVLTPAELVRLLIGDWWTWVWNQMGANGPPLAGNDYYLIGTSNVGGAAALTAPVNVLDNDFDPEHAPIVAVLHGSTSHGTITLQADGTFDYTPDTGFAGVDTFSYAAYDFVTESQLATVRISVGLRGDGDADQDVDGFDFLFWQRGLGATVQPPGSGADYDGDGNVDSADRVAWRYNFGVTLAPATPATVFPLPQLALAATVPVDVGSASVAPLLDLRGLVFDGTTRVSEARRADAKDQAFAVAAPLVGGTSLALDFPSPTRVEGVVDLVFNSLPVGADVSASSSLAGDLAPSINPEVVLTL